MRRSLAAHLDHSGRTVDVVTATHAHEEHAGNLSWAADRTGAPLIVAPGIAALLATSPRLPFSRRLVIGTPSAIGPHRPLGDRLDLGGGDDGDADADADGAHLDVHGAPGHCDDHIVLHDADEGVLIAGDTFMGTHFSTPNPDVDSRRWIATLEGLLDLRVDVLVEGHGLVHTMRTDIADRPGVVDRRHPKDLLAAKLEFLRWVDGRVAEAERDGARSRAAVAYAFPWGRRWGWERAGADGLIRAATGGHFSRSELIRSFRRDDDRAVLPEVRELTLVPRAPPGAPDASRPGAPTNLDA